MTETLDITIRKLGASGDGIADGMPVRFADGANDGFADGIRSP